MAGQRNERSAVVTGASSGIGKAIAVALAQSGVARILVHYRRNQTGAQQTVAACKDLGSEAIALAADLSQSDDRERLVDDAFHQFDSIQTWVNNAGADVLTGEARELDFTQRLKRLIDVDVIGTIALSRLVAARMLAQRADEETGPPSMVFIGWDQAPLGMEGEAGQMFAPVKAAVMAFAASLAQELAPKVRVNTIAPGWIQTSWGEGASQYWQDRARNQSLMNRWGRPEDVAKAVVYAVDPSNTFLTGQTIDLNGGWNRRFRS